jgi:hypothetical protein
VDVSVRGRIADALGTLIDNDAQIRELADLFLTSDIPNSIYSALWTSSRKVGVIIYVAGDPDSKHLVVEKPSSTRSEG